MLILTRKVNEKVVINENIVVSIMEIRGDMVKVGIEAPRSVKVYRSEVHEAILNENRRAADSELQLPQIEIVK